MHDGAPDETVLRRRAERRVELLSAFVRGIVCEFDSEGRYRDVWFTDERLLPMPAQDLLGRTITEALGADIGAKLAVGTARVYATGTPETFEYALALPTGTREFEARVVRVPNEDGGDPYRAVALIRDITDEKAIARKLGEAERLAALGVLAAGIGHEINNPLMVLQETARRLRLDLAGLSQDLPAAVFAERVRTMSEQIASVAAAATRMQKNVADLRIFRRDDAGDVAPVDPRAAVLQALELARGQLQQRAILEHELGVAPLVAIDATKLSQVVVNLLVNGVQAIAATEQHRARIRVTTRTDVNGRAVIEVADNGPGIPPHELERIFDPFFTTKREGMGLGLSVCRRLVGDHGGTIVAESTRGRGTTFRVVLPAASSPTVSPTGARVDAAALPRLRFLVIDDDPALLRVLASSLSEAHDVVVSDGGTSALALLAKDQQFDCVLCDLMMPFGGGMTFFRRLGDIAPALQGRVMFMTGGAFTPEAARFMETISNETIGKPFDLDRLENRVHAMLQKLTP